MLLFPVSGSKRSESGLKIQTTINPNVYLLPITFTNWQEKLAKLL